MKSSRNNEISVGRGSNRPAFVFLTMTLGFLACNDTGSDALAVAAGYSLAVAGAFVFSRRSPSLKLPENVRKGMIFILPGAAALYGLYEGWSGAETCAKASHAALLSALLHIVANRPSRPNPAAVHIVNLALFVAAAIWVHNAPFFALLLLFAAGYIGAALSSVYPITRSTLFPYAGIFVIYFAVACPLTAILFAAVPRNETRRPAKAPAKQNDPGNGGTGVDGATDVAPDQTGAFIGAPSRIDRASLKNLGKILSDNGTVMKIKLSTADGKGRVSDEPLYVRTMVYDRYDRGVWSSTRGTRRLNDGDDGVADGRISLRPLPSAREGILRQEVTASPVLGNALGAIPDALRLYVPSVIQTGDDAFSFIEPSDTIRRYVVESTRNAPDRNSLDNIVEVAGDDRDLQFPSELKRLKNVAQSATKGDKTIKSKANAIRRLLQRNYGYEMDAVDSTALDPVEEFLFERRSGICVHFATAMALMARSIGVRARVGVGFVCSEFSKDEESFIIRNADAHMWVEIFFGAEGWVIFDPTPESRWQSRGSGDTEIVSARPREKRSKNEKGFGASIFEFGGRDRDRLFSSISKSFSGTLAFIGRLLSSLIFYAACLALSVAVVVWYRLTPEKRRDLIMRRFRGFRRRSPVSFYNDFLWELSRLGLKKDPCGTIREFALQIPSSIPRESVDAIVSLYERAKFAQQSLSPGELAVAEEAIGSIRECGKRLRAPT